MRIFVTGTGRCGSVSFHEACKFITNYTTAHETESSTLEYPDNHIEVNPQFRKCIGRIQNKYPDSKWVHLIRSEAYCVPSLASLDGGEIMRGYYQLHKSIIQNDSPLVIASEFWKAENEIIACQLMCRVPHKQRRTIHLENINNTWNMFWDWIGAEGNFEESLNSWKTPHNTQEERGEVNVE